MNARLLILMWAIAAAAMLGLNRPAFADGDASPWDKLERGAINTVTGWMEPGVQAAKGAQGDSPFLGTFQGFGEGLLLGLQRTGLGLADSLSFPVGPYDQPTMHPETLFSSK